MVTKRCLFVFTGGKMFHVNVYLTVLMNTYAALCVITHDSCEHYDICGVNYYVYVYVSVAVCGVFKQT